MSLAVHFRHGTKIAFGRFAGPGTGDIYVMNVDGTGVMQLTSTGNVFPSDSRPTWSSDGTKIYFTRGLTNTNQEIYSISSDGSDSLVASAVTTNGVITRLPNFKPDGTKVVFDRGPAGTADVYVMNPDGTSQVKITNNGVSEAAAFSPDGTKITFDAVIGVFGPHDIFVMNADGTGQVNITNNPALDVQPDWGVVPAEEPDHYRCYEVAEVELDPRPIVDLADQFFTDEDIIATKAKMICAPVDKNGEGVTNSDTHLVCYETEPESEEAKLEVEIANQFGEQILEVKKSKLLCVPSRKKIIGNDD